ncbi:hypothetical protein ACOMHN_002627 [Nucella lapillus]
MELLGHLTADRTLLVPDGVVGAPQNDDASQQTELFLSLMELLGHLTADRTLLVPDGVVGAPQNDDASQQTELFLSLMELLGHLKMMTPHSRQNSSCP